MTLQYDPSIDIADYETVLQILDGSLDDERFAEFSRRAAEDPKLAALLLGVAEQRWTLSESLSRTAQYHEFSTAVKGRPRVEPASASDSTRFGVRAIGLLAAAIVLVGVAVGVFLMASGSSEVRVAVGRQVATAIHIDGTLIDANGDLINAGGVVREGRTTLESGAVELLTEAGVSVELVGPGQFELTSKMGAKVHRGTFVAAVPSGVVGYVVDTPAVRVVDLGTEFGVYVDDDGTTFVEVFSGRVELRPHDDAESDTIVLGPFEPVRISSAGDLEREPIHDSHFVDRRVMRSGWPGVSIEGRPNDTLRLDAVRLTPYADQDGIEGHKTEAVVGKDGSLHLAGNAWKAIAIDYDLTDSTVVEFEFRSDSAGEMSGIALDNDNRVQSGRRLFIVAGSTQHPQAWSDYKIKSHEEWTRVRIPVGRHYTGEVRQLVLFADDDANGMADAWFRDIRIYESTDSPIVDSAPENQEKNAPRKRKETP